jgi:hypothetical protein
MSKSQGFSEWEKLGLTKPDATDYEEHSAVGDLATGRRFKAVQSVPNKMYVDTVAEDVFYYLGDTKSGVTTDQPLWRIRRVLVTNSVTQFDFADGNDQFDNVWDDRASLSYS